MQVFSYEYCENLKTPILKIILHTVASDQAYKQNLFPLSRKMSFTQTKLFFVYISLYFLLEVLMKDFKESFS